MCGVVLGRTGLSGAPSSAQLLQGCLLIVTFALCKCNSFSRALSDDEFEELGNVEFPMEERRTQPRFRQRNSIPAINSWFKVANTSNTYYLEILMAVILVMYGLNYLYGRRKNEDIALDWAQEFCNPGALLERNFSLLGPGYGDNDDDMLMKQTQSQFQLWASGRRYCSGMLATLTLRARHDLISMALSLIEPCDDTVLFEVYMHEHYMPPTCFAVSLPKCLTSLTQNSSDLAAFAKPLDVERSDIRDWPPHLKVVAESSTVFYDLFSKHMIEFMFGSEANGTASRYLRWLHFSSEFVGDNESVMKVLRFSFKLPAQGRMHELSRMMEVMMKFIDVVGAYEMPAKAREKAERLRAEAKKREEKEVRKAHEEQLQKQKQEKREAEAAKLKSMTPEQREKYEAKRRKVEMGRMMKKRAMRK